MAAQYGPAPESTKAVENHATWFRFDSATELYAVPATAVHAELAGVPELVARAEHVQSGEPLHALHLLEIALAREPNHRGGLEARRTALETLLAQAQATFQNSDEMNWLGYRIRTTEAALESSVDGSRRIPQ